MLKCAVTAGLVFRSGRGGGMSEKGTRGWGWRNKKASTEAMGRCCRSLESAQLGTAGARTDEKDIISAELLDIVAHVGKGEREMGK